MEIVSKKEAKAKGLKTYFTGRACKYGHVAERSTSCSNCVECSREHSRKYQAANKDVVRKKNTRWREANKERVREYSKKYREANKEYYNSYNHSYYRENKDRIKEYKKEHFTLNRDRYYAATAKRRASELDRSIGGGFDSEIQTIYTEAPLLREQGENVHVDHIVPLQGEFVSGLHVPWNLQIISAEENLAKNNSFEPYVEFYALF